MQSGPVTLNAICVKCGNNPRACLALQRSVEIVLFYSSPSVGESYRPLVVCGVISICSDNAPWLHLTFWATSVVKYRTYCQGFAEINGTQHRGQNMASRIVDDGGTRAIGLVDY